MLENSPHHFTISIAGIVIRINTLYTRTYWLCKDYLCEKEPDFEVDISNQDLNEEQLIVLGTNERYMGGYYEPAVVHRKIVDRLIDYNAILLHGAAISVNGSGYIFSGKSGVGKTTHIMKWLEQSPDTTVINGDKPIIRYENNTFFVCGTPWSGKEHMNNNMMLPLNSIVFMTRSDNNSIKRMDFGQALPKILNQLYIPEEADKMQRTMNLLANMKNSVRFFDFSSNNFQQDSYQVSHDALIDGLV